MGGHANKFGNLQHTSTVPQEIQIFINILKYIQIYNKKNSREIAEEHTKVNINQNKKLITLDIKDLYTNLSK